jgi:hypothetical protein
MNSEQLTKRREKSEEGSKIASLPLLIANCSLKRVPVIFTGSKMGIPVIFTGLKMGKNSKTY